MRDDYPAGTIIDEDWSAFRKHAKARVAAVVEQHGTEILKQIPKRWPEFDAQASECGQ